jgi:glycosyltransferase involved in cell wall biosynthesis
MVSTVWRQRRNYIIAQVDVFSGPAFLWAEVVCGILQLLNKPFVLTLHGGNLPAFARRWPRRVQRLLRGAVAVTSPSPFLHEEMKSFRSDLLMLPNALDLNRYQFRLRRYPRPRLVWVRAFHESYNPSLAPRMLAELIHEYPDISLVMIGPDKGDGSLQKTKQVAAQSGVLEHMSFPGPIPKNQIPTWLSEGDIFVNTTNVDNTPVSVLEAMASGLCIVTTNVGGIPYLLQHERDGLLVNPNDPVAMAAAVRRFLTDPALAESLSTGARNKAEQYDWSMIMPQWTVLIEKSSLRNSR